MQVLHPNHIYWGADSDPSALSGLAFGTGSVVAHRAVDAVMGPKTVQHEHINAPPPESPGAPSEVAPGQDACQWQAKAFQDVSMGGGVEGGG